LEALADLGKRLEGFWRYYGQKARTKTRDTRAYGLSYLKGLLRMKTDRNMAEIAREADVSEQNMRHFISNSPWSGSEMIERAQAADLPFVAVAFDSLYGRSFWLREQCDAAGIE
jgi:SRSO17 transposase